MEKVNSNRHSNCFLSRGDTDDHVDWEDFVLLQGKLTIFKVY